MILAAGEGTRLRPLTLALPKPMVPVANKPLLVRTLELLAAQNIREIAVNLFHQREAIRTVLGEGEALGVRLRYSDEETLLGTAGGVKRMEAFLDEPFLVLYGDNLYQADFAPLLAFHRANGALATIATFKAPNPSACGLVVTDPSGRVTRFQEKPPPAEVFTNNANAGVYVLEPEVFASLAPNAVLDWGRDIFPALLSTRRVFAQSLNGYLQDTGTLPAYRQACWDVLNGHTGAPAEGANGALLVAPDAFVSPSATFEGRNVVGEGCRLETGAFCTDSILWENCRIGKNARINGAILGRTVVIGDDAAVEFGAVLANGASVAPGGRVPANARIGPNEHVS